MRIFFSILLLLFNLESTLRSLNNYPLFLLSRCPVGIYSSNRSRQSAKILLRRSYKIWILCDAYFHKVKVSKEKAMVQLFKIFMSVSVSCMYQQIHLIYYFFFSSFLFFYQKNTLLSSYFYFVSYLYSALLYLIYIIYHLDIFFMSLKWKYMIHIIYPYY